MEGPGPAATPRSEPARRGLLALERPPPVSGMRRCGCRARRVAAVPRLPPRLPARRRRQGRRRDRVEDPQRHLADVPRHRDPERLLRGRLLRRTSGSSDCTRAASGCRAAGGRSSADGWFSSGSSTTRGRAHRRGHRAPRDLATRRRAYATRGRSRPVRLGGGRGGRGSDRCAASGSSAAARPTKTSPAWAPSSRSSSGCSFARRVARSRPPAAR